jgi:hypothetical protein
VGGSEADLGEDDVGGVGRAEAPLGDVEHGAAPEHPLGEVVGGASVGGHGRGRGGGGARGGGRRRRRGGGATGVGGGGLHPPAASGGLATGREKGVGLGFGRLIRPRACLAGQLVGRRGGRGTRPS